MSLRRGEVVLVAWPLAKPVGGKVSKVRPALVIQNDRDNQRLTNTILAMITGQTRRTLEVTQLFIDISTPDGRQTGLRHDSAVNCINLLTVEQQKIITTIGTFSQSLIQDVNHCLKEALELS
jgi:mRNA interferase MazF